MSVKNDPISEEFKHPIKAPIENESNICEKRKTILHTLFNVKKSNRYAETIMGESDFYIFISKQERQGAENDSLESRYRKYEDKFYVGSNLYSLVKDDKKFKRYLK